jgi:hypothetical protein
MFHIICNKVVVLILLVLGVIAVPLPVSLFLSITLYIQLLKRATIIIYDIKNINTAT